MSTIGRWLLGLTTLILGVAGLGLAVAGESHPSGYVISTGDDGGAGYTVLPEGAGAHAVGVGEDGGVRYLALPEAAQGYAVGVGNGRGVRWWTDDKLAYLGVSLEEETEHPEGGARVTDVVEGSPAAAGGLREEDIIVGFAGQTIRGPAGLTERLHEQEAGDSVSIEIIREGREQTLEVELGSRAEAWPYSVAPLRALPRYAPPSGVWSLDCEDDDCRALTFGPFGRPRLGVQLVETTRELRRHFGGNDTAGVLVSKVLGGTAAEEAGIEVGDNWRARAGPSRSR
jgi:membrane-associated protease RseP (regulator of RpoE activity)